MLGETAKHLMALLQGSGTPTPGYDLRLLYGKETKRKMSVGALYTTLERLTDKGFLKYELRDGDPERGGRPQRFFSLTGEGVFALNEAYRIDASVFAYAKLGSSA